jgi:uncharacterized protein YlxW (UPF0749 family)
MVEKNPSVSVRISLLEHDMLRANTTLDKMNTAMEKHREESNHDIGKIYDRMEDFRAELKEDINTLKSDLDKKMETQNQILTKISDKLNDLNKWRWIVVGMATVAGFILSKIMGIKIF